MTIVWSQRAVDHLTQLREYIAHDNPAAAAKVGEKILQSIESLASQPGMGRPGRLPGTRELVVSGTPYVIPYRVRRNRLELIAVFHGRQKWPARFQALE
jgi:addiction module RelE/StbE family toxin